MLWQFCWVIWFRMIYTAIDNFYLTNEHLKNSPSRKDSIDEDTETTLRIYGCDLIQESGILLKLYPVFSLFLYMLGLWNCLLFLILLVQYVTLILVLIDVKLWRPGRFYSIISIARNRLTASMLRLSFVSYHSLFTLRINVGKYSVLWNVSMMFQLLELWLNSPFPNSWSFWNN